MNVQVNAKAAATRIKDFIKASGGTAQHSDVLELVAGVCGFDSYRAMKAHTDKAAPTPVVTPVAEVGGNPLEDSDNVVYRTVTTDWRLAQNPKLSLKQLPQEKRRKYDVVLESTGNQFRLLLKPLGVDMDSFQGHPVLDMLIEVNEGVPCVHMTNDPADAMLLTVFATEGGFLVRSEDGKKMSSDDVRAPAVLRNLAEDGCNPEERSEAHFLVLDTAAKYQDSNLPKILFGTVSDADMKKDPAIAYPVARTEVLFPVQRKRVDNTVVVRYIADFRESDRLRVEIEVQDANGVPGDQDYGYVLTPFTSESSHHAMYVGACGISNVVSFFIAAGYSIQEIEPIFRAIAESQQPAELASQIIGFSVNAPDRNQAFTRTLELLAAPDRQAAFANAIVNL